MSLDAITQAAHEIAERAEVLNDKALRVAAERVVQLAADVAATHEKIREHAEAIKARVLNIDARGSNLPDAEAILGLLKPSEHTPERMGLGQICACGHTLGCDCRKCPLCIREHTHEETT